MAGAMKRASLVATTGATLLLATSCSEEIVVRPVRDGVGGTIAGTVRVAEGPGNAQVWAESIEGLPWDEDWYPSTWIRGETDAAGRFRVQVPAGEYRLHAHVSGMPEDQEPYFALVAYWSREGIVPEWQEGDTLSIEVGATIDSLEFEFGRLALRLNLPEEWVGGHYFATIKQSEGPSRWAGFSDRVSADIPSSTVDLQIPVLPAGEYRVSFEVEYFDRASDEVRRVSLWLPAGLAEEHAEPIVVRALETTTQEFTVTPQRFHITGSIDGVWSSFGIDPPRVYVFSADSARIGSRPCDAAGDFEATFWARVPVKLAVGTSSEVTWIGGPRFDEATLFEPPADGELRVHFTDSAIEVHFPGLNPQTTQDWSLRLTDPTGAPVMAVRIHDWPNEPALVPFLPGGSYRIHVRPEPFLASDWRPQWYDRADDLAEAMPIVVQHEGEVVSVDVALQSGAQIRGTVREPGGSPMADFSVYLTRVDSGTILGDKYEGKSQTGEYVLRGLPAGRYRVGALEFWEYGEDAADLPSRTRWYQDRITWADADVITIAGTDSVTGIDFSLP